MSAPPASSSPVEHENNNTSLSFPTAVYGTNNNTNNKGTACSSPPTKRADSKSGESATGEPTTNAGTNPAHDNSLTGCVIDPSQHPAEEEEEEDAGPPFLCSDPNVLSKYLQRAHIGKGEYSETSIAINRQTGLQVAAKVTDLTRLQSDHMEFVIRELECLRTCDHPNVMKLLDSHESKRKFIAILELCDAGDLHDQVHNNNVRFDEDQVAIILVQLIMGIHHIHKNNIIHRDIKTQNIMLTTSGFLKIGDFGFSKRYDVDVSGNVAGSFLGTPYYLSPERWLQQAYSKKADIWSIGVTTYELLAGGRRPFTGATRDDIRDGALRVDPPPIVGVSDEMMRIVKWMLTKDPEKRPDAFQLLQHRVLRRALIRFVYSVVRDDAAERDPRSSEAKRNEVRGTRKSALREVERLQLEFKAAGVPVDSEFLPKDTSAVRTVETADPHAIADPAESARALRGPVKLRSTAPNAGFVWKERELVISQTEICVSLPPSKQAAQGSPRSQTLAIGEVTTVSVARSQPTTESTTPLPSFIITIKLRRGSVILGLDTERDLQVWVAQLRRCLSSEQLLSFDFEFDDVTEKNKKLSGAISFF